MRDNRPKVEVVTLMFEFLGTNDRMGGKWLKGGKKTDPLEKWVQNGYTIAGQSQSVAKGFFSGQHRTTVTYTLVKQNS
jgi:hypothetical protein